MPDETPEQPSDPTDPPPRPTPPPQPTDLPGQFTQSVRHQQVSALVPEEVARGVFASGALVFAGAHELVVDFIQAIARPHSVVCRVILPPTILPNVLGALKTNLDNYHARFGPIAEPPMPNPPPPPPTIEEIYSRFKIPDDVQSGVYTNTVMMTHTHSDFCFDFITGFYPRSAVAARVFTTVQQIPRLHQMLSRSFEQWRSRQRPPEP
jgi:hypothetical protein